METVLMTVAYDGSRFFGWQRQNELRSVQRELEKALSHALKQPIKVDASGRTVIYYQCTDCGAILEAYKD